jgi:hypothetical protein
MKERDVRQRGHLRDHAKTSTDFGGVNMTLWAERVVGFLQARNRSKAPILKSFPIKLRAGMTVN